MERVMFPGAAAFAGNTTELHLIVVDVCCDIYLAIYVAESDEQNMWIVQRKINCFYYTIVKTNVPLGS